jgi:ferredoxin-NADP reductase
MKEAEFYREAKPDCVSPEPLDESLGGSGSTTRSQKIIDDDRAFAIPDRIIVYLEHALPILERVLLAHGLPGKLSKFSDGHKRQAEFEGEGHSKDETPGFNSDNNIGPALPGEFCESVNDLAHSNRICKYRRYVFEHDARRRKVGNIAHKRLKSEFCQLFWHRSLSIACKFTPKIGVSTNSFSCNPRKTRQPMTDNRLQLVSSREIAEGTREFTFERPAGFDYVAGQTIDLYLVDPPEMDDEGPVRTFSLVSAPFEPNLKIATRMRDTAFKRILKGYSEGEQLAWDGPYGSFTLHKNAASPAVFLSGGIGITPFMSLLKWAAHENLPHKIFLFYSNRRPEDTAFLAELQELARQNPNITLVLTMTEMEKSTQSWDGETGFIDRAMLSKYIDDLAKPIYYIAGPPQMVAAMKKMAIDAGADEDRVRFEEFPGY